MEDADKKRKISTPLGVQCMTMRKRPEDRMEWAIGGVAEGMDHAVPGTCTGMIRLTVTGNGTRWELDVPIAYTVHEGKENSVLSILQHESPEWLKYGC